MSGDLEIEVLEIPADWRFYQATLDFGTAGVVVAAEPFGSVACPTITLEMQTKRGAAVAFLTAEDAAELWTALGDAIRTATGKDPVAAALLCDDGPPTPDKIQGGPSDVG